MEHLDYTFRVAVCDDEQKDRECICGMLDNIFQEERIDASVRCYSNGGELLRVIREEEKFDLILLDVIMDDMGGMELAEYLRRGIFNGSIVFISVNKEMALQGYEVSASRYLAKPLEIERLREAVLYCYQCQIKNKAILVPQGGTIQKVFPHEILYVETERRGSRIVIENEREKCALSTSLKISELEPALSKQNFIRCHQGFLVNLHYAQSLQAKEIALFDGTKIPVSKHRIQEVRREFFSYLEEI